MAKTCREGLKSTVNMVVNDKAPWIDWKMSHNIGGVHVGLGGPCPFFDLVRPITHVHPQVNVGLSRRILCFQRRKFKKSGYIVHLFEWLP